jgi:threonine aldolase
MLGGFIREASVMAVAGIYALENMVDRVLEDNQRAADIADRLISLQGLEIDPYPIPSNIIILNLKRLSITPTEFATWLEINSAVRVHVIGTQAVRLAIHRHIGSKESDVIVSAITELVTTSFDQFSSSISHFPNKETK